MKDEVKVRLTLEDYKAVRALLFAQSVLAEAVEDQPWNGELRKALRALRYAGRRLAVEGAE